MAELIASALLASGGVAVLFVGCWLKDGLGGQNRD